MNRSNAEAMAGAAKIVIVAISMTLVGSAGCGGPSQTETRTKPQETFADLSVSSAATGPDASSDSVATGPDSSLVVPTDPIEEIAESSSGETPEPESHTAPATDPDPTAAPAGLSAGDPMTNGQQVAEPPHHRVLIPTTAGLILLDVDVRIGEATLDQAFEQQIEQVLHEINASGNGTWSGLLELINSNPNRFGRSLFNAQQTNQVERLFDANRNGRPDSDEAAKILFRRSGSDEAFRVDGTDWFRVINRTRSPVFHAIDQDQDGQLNTAEMQASSVSILQLDRNGDGRIERSEVIPDTQPNDPAWDRQRRSRWGDVAMDLAGYVNWQMLTDALERSGSTGGFHSEPGLMARLDTDGDGSISATEAEGLLHVEPDIRLQIRFPANPADEAAVEVLSISEPIRSNISIEAFDQHVWLLGESLQLAISITDLIGQSDRIPPETFAALDVDGDGGLQENEIPAGALRDEPFDQLDLDGDGKLTQQELTRAMALRPSVWSVQVRGRAAESNDALFDWLDHNHDRMLSSRDLQQVASRLSQLAAVQQPLRAEAIPDVYHIQFGRGDPDRDPQWFSLPITTDPRRGTPPRWAEAMDRNGDGEIEAAEFIGTVDQFRTLDQDGDGFIDPIESGGSLAKPEGTDPESR